jgi:hypothetical protein
LEGNVIGRSSISSSSSTFIIIIIIIYFVWGVITQEKGFDLLIKRVFCAVEQIKSHWVKREKEK